MNVDAAYEQAESQLGQHAREDTLENDTTRAKTVDGKGQEEKEKLQDDLLDIPTANARREAKETALRAKRERDELRCLVEFMDRDMQDIFDVKRQILNHTLKEISFEHLWQLYKPGDIVYNLDPQKYSSHYQAYRILNVTGGRMCFDRDNKTSFDAVRNREWDSESESETRCRDAVWGPNAEVTSFVIDCFHLDSDGARIGPRPKRFAIPRYMGTRSVFSLVLRPGIRDSEHQKVMDILIQRGARFVELASNAHKQYSGNSIREARQTRRG